VLCRTAETTTIKDESPPPRSFHARVTDVSPCSERIRWRLAAAIELPFGPSRKAGLDLDREAVIDVP